MSSRNTRQRVMTSFGGLTFMAICAVWVLEIAQQNAVRHCHTMDSVIGICADCY